VERALSQARAWVEQPFHIVKNLFRHKKLRYIAVTEPRQ
jgi:IS5 family transposase